VRSIIAGMRRCSTGELVCVCAHACAGKYSVFKCIAYTCEHAYDVPHAHECANNSHCSTTCLHTHTHVRACVRFTCQPVGSPDPCAASCRLLALAGLLGRIARTRLPSAAPSPQAQNAVQRSGRQADRRAASPHGAIPPGIMTPAGPAGRRRHAMHHQYEGGEAWRRHAECSRRSLRPSTTSTLKRPWRHTLGSHSEGRCARAPSAGWRLWSLPARRSAAGRSWERFQTPPRSGAIV